MHYRRFALQVKKNALNPGLSVAVGAIALCRRAPALKGNDSDIPTPRNYNPTSDFARMFVWISDVPPMMVKARELR